MSKVNGEIFPCPLCGNHLIWTASSAQAGIRDPFYEHPDTGDCVLRVLTFMDRPEQVAAWNRRAALEAVSSIYETEPAAYYMVRYTPEPSEWDEAPEEVVDFTPDAALAYSSWNFEAEVTPLFAHPAPISKGVTPLVPDERLEAMIGPQTASPSEIHDMAVELILHRRLTHPAGEP